MVGQSELGLLDPGGPPKGDTCVFQPGQAAAFVVFASGSLFLLADEPCLFMPQTSGPLALVVDDTAELGHT